MGLVNFVNQKPMRQGKDVGSPLATLGYVCIHRAIGNWTYTGEGNGLMNSMGLMGVVSLAVPRLTLTAQPPSAPVVTP